MTTQEGVTPDSLVARMIGELNANPEARTLLLRALLTDDFLLLPAKVDRLMELPAKVDGTTGSKKKYDRSQQTWPP